MIQLSKLSPAETVVILNPSDSTIKKILKVTFMDLFYKQALSLQVVEPEDPEQAESTLLIRRGRLFDTYAPKPLEDLILRYFAAEEELDLKLLVKGIKSELLNPYAFKKKYVLANGSNQYFSNSFLYSLFNVLKLNKEGIFLQSYIIKRLHEAEKEMLLSYEDPEALEALINELGGNIFLLKNFQFKYLKEINEEFKREVASTTAFDSSPTGTLIFWDSFSGSEDFMDSNDHQFDSFFDGIDDLNKSSGCSSGGSGCSSDSGYSSDSGCSSGCSGCGGCGGGCS